MQGPKSSTGRSNLPSVLVLLEAKQLVGWWQPDASGIFFFKGKRGCLKEALAQKAVPSTLQIQCPLNTHRSVTGGNLLTSKRARREGTQINITDCTIKLVPIHLEAGKNQGRISKSFYTIKERDRWWEGVRTENKTFKVCYFKLKINHNKKEYRVSFYFQSLLLSGNSYLVFGGREGEANWQTTTISLFTPSSSPPNISQSSHHVLPEFYNLELWLSNNWDSTVTNLRDVRQSNPF